MKKTFGLVFFPALFCLGVVACVNLTPAQSEKLKQTAEVIAGRVASIAGNALLNSLQRENGGDYLHSAATGLRSGMGEIITAEDLREVVRIWTPKAPEWERFADIAADEYGRAIERGVPSNVAIEAIATGAQAAAEGVK